MDTRPTFLEGRLHWLRRNQRGEGLLQQGDLLGVQLHLALALLLGRTDDRGPLSQQKAVLRSHLQGVVLANATRNHLSNHL